jgi:glycosyltransferase involved in cell wall biosynthesis
MVVHGPYPVGEPRVAREAIAAIEAGFVAMHRPGEPRIELVEGVRVLRLPIGHARGVGAARLLAEYLAFTVLASAAVASRFRRRRFDVVHIHTPPDFLLIAAVIPRLLGSRVVLDIHDRSPDMLAMRFSGPAARAAGRLLHWVERLGSSFADAVLTVHEPYRRELVAHGIPTGKVVVVMNSLDERLLPPAESWTTAPLRIVYHGTVTPSYGVHLAVEAAAMIAAQGIDVRLEVLGEGDSVPDLRRRVEELRISDRVAIEGEHLSHRDVLERVNGASVGVIPNLPTRLNKFALSSKLFEYVLLGIPVVSAALPTIQEYFSSDEVRFFEPGSADSLAEALLAVSRDPEGAAARVKRARGRYDDYRWEVSARRYISILERLSSGTADPPVAFAHTEAGERSS